MSTLCILYNLSPVSNVYVFVAKSLEIGYDIGVSLCHEEVSCVQSRSH